MAAELTKEQKEFNEGDTLKCIISYADASEDGEINLVEGDIVKFLNYSTTQSDDDKVITNKNYSLVQKGDDTPGFISYTWFGKG